MVEKNNIVYREDIEWSNTWIAKANQSCRRCLLIGDSTTRGIRPKLEIMAWELMAVDIYAASYAIEDVWFWKSLECFLKSVNMQYDLIIIHYGYHHGFGTHCYSNEDDWKTYFDFYDKLVQLVKGYGQNLLMMTGTSEHMKENVDLIWDEREKEIRARNDIAQRIANKNGVKLFDLYQIMNTEGVHYKYRDVQHFELSANSFIAYKLMTFIINQYNHLEVEAKKVKEKLREKFCFSNRRIMIYGNGNDGNCIYWFCKFLGIDDRVECYLAETNEGTYSCGIPIRGIETISEEEKREVCVIVETDNVVKKCDTLNSFCFKNWYTYLELFNE